MEFILKNFKNEINVKRLANIHYFEFTKDFHTKDDNHDFCELIYVDRGRIEISSSNYVGKLTEGCMIVHGAGERHSLTCRENAAPNVIIIGFECKSKEIDRLTHAPLALSDDMQKTLAEIIKEARTVYMPPYDIPNLADMKKRESFAYGADQLIKDYLQMLLIKAIRLTDESAVSDRERTNTKLSRIAEVKKYIDDNFKERIGIEELCFLFNTNRSTLSGEFKRAYKSTIIDYINYLRVEYTKKKLTNDSLSLTEISERLNLSSVHYLTLLFKKHMGVSPTEYVKYAGNTKRHLTK